MNAVIVTYDPKKMIENEINYFWFAYVEATQTVRYECVFFYLFCGFVVFLPSAEGALSPPSFLNAIVIGWKMRL